MTKFIRVAHPPDLTNFIVKSNDRYSNAGSFGDVYKCWYKQGADARKEVAVKAFRFLVKENMIRRELGIWKRLSHKNIVPFLGITYGFGMQGTISLVSLWMVNGTLLEFLEKHDDKLTIVHRLQLLLDIANGLDYCAPISPVQIFQFRHQLYTVHSLPIIHGDLNCNNVLLDANYTARLTDFGYASLVGNIPEALAYLEMSTTRPGAMRWAAPEQILPQPGSKLTTKSDMYSLGSLSLQESLIDVISVHSLISPQVLSGKRPWSEVKNDSYIVICISRGLKPSRPDTRAIDNHHWDFIERCWLSVQERPSATEAIACIQQFLNYRLPVHDHPTLLGNTVVGGGGPTSSDHHGLVSADRVLDISRLHSAGDQEPFSGVAATFRKAFRKPIVLVQQWKSVKKDVRINPEQAEEGRNAPAFLGGTTIHSEADGENMSGLEELGIDALPGSFGSIRSILHARSARRLSKLNQVRSVVGSGGHASSEDSRPAPLGSSDGVSDISRSYSEKIWDTSQLLIQRSWQAHSGWLYGSLILLMRLWGSRRYTQINRELAEEGGDIPCVGSSRGVEQRP